MRGLRLPTLLRYLAEDRLLAVTTAVLSVLVLLPLTQTELVPIVDLPIHAALVSQLNRLLAGDPVASEHFMLQPHPAPYWLLYLLLWGAMSAFGTFLGCKLVMAFALLVVPLGFIRLCGAIGRSPRIGLWAFAFCWDFNQSMGFQAFTMTTGLSFFFLARCLDALERPSLSGRWWTGTVGLGLLLANSHAHAAGTASVLAGALALAELPDRRRFWRMGWLSTVPVLALVPWLLATQLHKVGTERDPVSHAVGLWPNAGLRVSQLLDNTFHVVAHIVARNVAGLTLLILLLLPLLYALGAGWTRDTRRAVGLYVSMWVFYLVMPEILFRPFYQWFINTRFASSLLMLGLLLPARRFRGREAWLLAPGVLVAAALALCVTWQFHTYRREVAPFWRVIDRFPAGSRVNWVLWENGTRSSVFRSITSLPAYLITEKGGYSPHLFQSPNLPVVYRDAAHLGFAPWYQPWEFDPVGHARGYDFVLVQGMSPEEQERQRELRALAATDVAKSEPESRERTAAERLPDGTSTPRGAAAPERGPRGGPGARTVRRRPDPGGWDAYYEALEWQAELPPDVLARGDGLELKLVLEAGIWRLYEVRELEE
jgi:hypothetical protein